MKKIHLIVLGLFTTGMALTSCHENLEERTARECKEYTEKYCPMPVAANVVTDSMVLNATPRPFIITTR